jgi:hypothetical protein
MASERSECESGTEVDILMEFRGWVAWHPDDGFAYGMGADGKFLLRIYEEIDKELIEDIEELNADYVSEGDEPKWKAVKMVATKRDWKSQIWEE